MIKLVLQSLCKWWNIFIIIQNLNIMIFKLLLHLMKKLDMVVITLMLITSMHNMLIPLMVEIFTLLNMKTLTHLVPKWKSMEEVFIQEVLKIKWSIQRVLPMNLIHFYLCICALNQQKVMKDLITFTRFKELVKKQLLNILFVTMTYNKQINNAKTLKTLQSS